MVHNYSDDCRDDDFFDIVRNCFDHDRAVELVEGKKGDEDGRNMKSEARMVGIQVCNNQEEPAESLVVVDEADELLRGSSCGFSLFGFEFGGGKSTEKGVMNSILDEMKIPTVWISNAPARNYLDADFGAADADKLRMNILFFDEVDGLLQDRAGASRSWEITQVNEFLQQMENFDGVMVSNADRIAALKEACALKKDGDHAATIGF